MGGRKNTRQRGFVLEVGGRRILAFLAEDIQKATQLCAEAWFGEALAGYRSDGRPVWDGETEFRIRPANGCEIAELQLAVVTEQARQEYEGYIFVFFLPIDEASH
jgi:hypothetical protein